MTPFWKTFFWGGLLRKVRGWIYRHWPGSSREAHFRRRKGSERFRDAEKHAFTQESWVGYLRKHSILGEKNCVIVELAAGDGLVGSLGVWLEEKSRGVECYLWEHREIPFQEALRRRPTAGVRAGRLLDWGTTTFPNSPWLVTSRCARQSRQLWRAVGANIIQPKWVVIWNPSGRGVWWHRARQTGYQLYWMQQNYEYYWRT
jgi:hypothetical protein